MEPKRLFDFLPYQLEHHPQEKAVGYRKGGKWIHYSAAELADMVNRMSLGLLRLGVRPGDKIALVTYQNRPEWTVVDLGMQQIGAINVPVYPTISSREYAYIFKEAEVKYCFCGKGDLADKVRAAQKNVPSLQGIYAFDENSPAPLWTEVWAEGDLSEVRRIMDGIQPDDLATIIYTSGTTGDPKGVMLTHNNIVSNILAVSKIIPLDAGLRALSFLPLCHIFERAVMYSYLYMGVNIHFTGTDNLGGEEGDLRAVRPHFFTTVPRLLEKVYEKIYNKGLELTGLKKKLFFWALSLTDRYEFDRQPKGWEALQWKLADRLIFSKWRQALGGCVKGIITGAAPCPEKMIRVFSAAGIPIREGYGLTETSPALAVSCFEPGGALIGAVGPPVDGVDLRIDDSDGLYGPGEGEILAHGPNVMVGYYKKPDATAAVMREIDGRRYFCTGDVGRWVTNAQGRKFLKITDRKKELLKTSGGKYVAPAPIENRLKEDFLIEQAMVVGEKQKFVSALIVPASEALRDWCLQNDIPWTNRAEAIRHPRVVARYQQIIEEVNPEFGHIEQIKKFRLLDADWEPFKTDGSEAELTPTMKLKRRVIREKFCQEIEAIYKED